MKKVDVPILRWGKWEATPGWKLDVPGLAAAKHPDGYHWMLVHLSSGKRVASVPRRKDVVAVALAISDVDWTEEEPEVSHLRGRLRDVTATLYGAQWRRENK